MILGILTGTLAGIGVLALTDSMPLVFLTSFFTSFIVAKIVD